MNWKPLRRDPPPTKRSKPGPPAPPSNTHGVRLQKILADAGLGSRREIEGWIRAGRVTVDGRPARLGERATPGARIALDGKPLARHLPAPPRLLLYHKPVGELVTRRDPQGRPTVFDRLPALARGRWIAVGRLDLNSSGLLLFTDSGDLADRLMHPRHAIEREYRVRVLGPLGPADRSRLRRGIRLEDGVARFSRIEPVRTDPGAGANRWYRVVLAEGRRREVRRMFEALRRPVSRLVRVRYGPLGLPRTLAPGRWVEASAAELRALLAAVRTHRRTVVGRGEIG